MVHRVGLALSVLGLAVACANSKPGAPADAAPGPVDAPDDRPDAFIEMFPRPDATPKPDAPVGCGDGVIDHDAGEDCDFDEEHFPILGGASCADVGYPDGEGGPFCATDCRFDTLPCGGVCGDDVKGGPEECDGDDHGGQTCADLEAGFTAGVLLCNEDCTRDTAGCTTCGDGTLALPEECDDGNTMNGDGCDDECLVEGECDPDDLWTVSGAAISYQCCISVNVDFITLMIVGDGASIVPNPNPAHVMNGAATTCPGGSISNTKVLAGGCTETYSLTGTFTDANTFTGTYSVTFTGDPYQCSCFDGALGDPCVDQTFPVTATR